VAVRADTGDKEMTLLAVQRGRTRTENVVDSTGESERVQSRSAREPEGFSDSAGVSSPLAETGSSRYQARPQQAYPAVFGRTVRPSGNGRLARGRREQIRENEMPSGQTKILRTDGTEEIINRKVPWTELETILNCDCFDTVNLHDGHVMLVDDNGIADAKQINHKATDLYHGVCRPGTTFPIVGDVAIVWDEDFA